VRTSLRILALLAMFVGGPAMGQQAATQPAKPAAAAAQQDIAGVWQGKLQVDPTTQLNIHFTFTKQPNGTYAAVLNSPDTGGIKNVAASSVALKNGALTMQVPSLSGTYAGTLKGGSIEGKWTQQGTAIPLTLTPYQKAELSKAAVDTLVGTWNGPIKSPGGTLTFVARFKVDDKGVLNGTLAVPEQGSTEFPMADIEFADNKLEFKIPRVQGQFTGSYANASFTGTWRQGPATGAPGAPVTLKKGEFAAPVYALKLSTESFAALSGNWEGTLKVKPPQGGEVSLPVVLRFLTNESAQYIAFLDSPSQKAMGIPVTDVTLAGGKLVLKVGAVGAEYKADVTAKTLVGQWTQGPVSNPLTMTRK
jgi:hypothetical protein